VYNTFPKVKKVSPSHAKSVKSQMPKTTIYKYSKEYSSLEYT